MKTLLVAVILAILFVPSLTPAYKQVRDGSGNLVETWTRQGDRIEVRDKDNNLKEQRRRVGDRMKSVTVAVTSYGKNQEIMIDYASANGATFSI